MIKLRAFLCIPFAVLCVFLLAAAVACGLIAKLVAGDKNEEWWAN